MIFDGEMVEASTLEKADFMQVFRKKLKPTQEQEDLISEWYDFNKSAIENCKNKDGGTGLFRETGEPYFNHVASVAMNAMQLLPNCDVDMVLALLAHDTPEDTGGFCLPRDQWDISEDGLLGRNYVDFDALAARVGERAARMIVAVQKPQLMKPKSKCTEDELEIYRLAKCNDIIRDSDVAVQAVIMKMFDRAHNLITICSKDLDDLTDEGRVKAQKKIRETRDKLMPVLQAVVNDNPLDEVLGGLHLVFKQWFSEWLTTDQVKAIYSDGETERQRMLVDMREELLEAA